MEIHSLTNYVTPDDLDLDLLTSKQQREFEVLCGELGHQI